MLKEIFKKNWKRIILTYSLYNVENVIILLFPITLGRFIDWLIVKDLSSYWPLWELVIILFGFLVIYFSRSVYDTYTFSGIYTKMISNLTKEQILAGVDSSKIVARVGLSRSIVNFFENDLPLWMYSFFSLVGSLYFIAMISHEAIITILVLAVPIMIVSFKFNRVIKKYIRKDNDLQESIVDVIQSEEMTRINRFFTFQNMLTIRISNLHAKNGLFINALDYLSLILALYFFISENAVTVGIVMSLYQYVNRFSGGLLMIPNLIISLSRIKDVVGRMEEFSTKGK